MENLEVGWKYERVLDISGVDAGCGRRGMRTGVAGGGSWPRRCASVLSYVSGASSSTNSSAYGAMLGRVALGYAGGACSAMSMSTPTRPRENVCAPRICSCSSRGADTVEYIDAVSNVSSEPVRAIRGVRPGRGTASRLWRCTGGPLRSRRASLRGTSGDIVRAARAFLGCMRGDGV